MVDDRKPSPYVHSLRDCSTFILVIVAITFVIIGPQSRLISWGNECAPTIKILGSLVLARRMRLRAVAKLCVRARDRTLDERPRAISGFPFRNSIIPLFPVTTHAHDQPTSLTTGGISGRSEGPSHLNRGRWSRSQSHLRDLK